ATVAWRAFGARAIQGWTGADVGDAVAGRKPGARDRTGARGGRTRRPGHLPARTFSDAVFLPTRRCDAVRPGRADPWPDDAAVFGTREKVTGQPGRIVVREAGRWRVSQHRGDD